MKYRTEDEPRVLHYKVDNPSARSQGRCYWLVGLNDGREISLWCDSVEIDEGCLEAWQTENVIEPKLGFVLAPGTWIYAFEANPIDGRPICVDRIPDPKR